MSQNVVITKKARKKLVQARAGAVVLPAIVGMVFGSGGVDGADNVITPSDSQNELNNELLRKELDSYSFINDTTCRYECTLSESELEGEYISEIGLYDSEGDIVCIKNFTKKGKDSGLQMTYTLDDVF